MKRPSIQRQLVLGIGIFITLVLTTCVVLMFLIMRKALYEQVDQDLQTHVETIIPEVEFEHGKIKHEWLDHLTYSPERLERDYIQVWNASNKQSQDTTKSPALENHSLPQFYGVEGEPKFKSIRLENGIQLRAIGLKFKARKSHGNHEMIIVLAHETTAIQRVMTLLKIGLPIGLILVALLGILITRWLIKGSLKPIAQLEADISQIDADSPDAQPLAIADDLPSELCPLVTHNNNLLDRIASARTRERRFSAHAAHELRTPLAGIYAILQQALKQPRSPESYRERIGEGLEITSKMRVLMDRLMHFSQLQSGTKQIQNETFSLTEIIKKEIRLLQTSADQRQLRFVNEMENMTITSDPELLRIIVKNLLDNAVSYADTGTSITLSTSSEGKDFIWKISNYARDINCDDLGHLFDAFHRKDSARSADSNHFGLGLSLAREISRCLGISLSAELDNNQLLTFILQWRNE